MERNYFADKLANLKVPQLGVSLTTYYCGDKVAYKMYQGRNLIFKGTDFGPSPLYDWDSLENTIALLGFLCVQQGDTDPEYFEHYTDIQFAWISCFECEQLKCLISDIGDVDGDYYDDSIKEFKFKTL